MSALTDNGIASRFTSALHSPSVSARVGRWLGICFAICLITGLFSSLSQMPNPPFPLPTRPSWGYRVTQGLHVATGTAAVPLLLIKLWSVYPLFFRKLAARGRALALDLTERASIAVLVSASLLTMITGVMNVGQWYPWGFGFRTTHYALAFIAVGSMLVHIAVKLPIITSSLRERPRHKPAGYDAISRRSFLRTSYVAAGVAALASFGSNIPGIRDIGLLAVRTGEGPQGIPINRTAAAAQVTDADTGADYRLELVYGDRTISLTLDEIRALPQHEAELPIACVEGWSASGHWRGVRVRELVALIDAPDTSQLRITSMQRRGGFSTSVMPANFAADPLSLLALELGGEPLVLDHGAPCRIIAPNRPGVLQTKWVHRIEVFE